MTEVDGVFAYDPARADEVPLTEGATDVWLYLHRGPGPAKAIRALAVTGQPWLASAVRGIA